MKKLLILAIILPLAGCNLFGSDGDKKSPPVVVQPSDPVTPEEPPVEEEPVNETREEMIERELNLPPEPDKEDNLSILGGLDSNGNGVPDDVERYNAFTFYPDKKKIAVVDELARLHRELYFIYDDLNAHLERNKQVVGLIACKYRLFSKKERSHYSVDIMHREAKRAEADVAKAFKADFDKFEKDHHYELYLHGRVDIDKSEKLCDEFLSKIE